MVRVPSLSVHVKLSPQSPLVLFDLNSLDLMKGMREGIENQKVGSRVLVLVPSAVAKGEGDRILVVDILAATTKQGEEEK